ncbi:MAG TPA: nucleotidyltransferase domain-containing protein [Candidatus Dormibacteraeota bacterium]|jgi:predicted nucleotidyltransferase
MAHLLDDLLRNRTHVRMARALFRLPEGFGTSARDLGRRAGVDNKLAQAALMEMAEAGLVVVTRTRAANYYRLNPKHVLYEPMKELFSKEGRVATDLMQTVASAVHQRKLPVRSAYLFGSTARRADELSSDIDIAVLTSPSHRASVEAALNEVGQDIRERFGREAHFIVETRSLKNLVADEPSQLGIWHRVQNEGQELL